MSIQYFTDGIHLYEVIRVIENAGKTGGMIMTVRNCLSGEVRELNEVEQKLLSFVIPDDDGRS